ncbi:MAG TPA: efflux RND transporter periplasmic adaptor subunit [Pseudomonadales bacterium]|nr:efflux RND transporter periplasmic adaptor subunit [Pseudomonadales bacterium]
MSDKNLIAVLIAVAMGLWLLSGEFGGASVNAEEAGAQDKKPEIPLVRGVESTASQRVQYLEVRGQTQANRIVQVRVEVSGRVEAIPAVKGTRVKAGDLLCKIAVDTRQSDLDEARANVRSATLEYKGLTDLKKQGLQSEISIAKARAALEASRAQEKRAELALAKTRITAPFDGVVETQPVEIGDFLTTGQLCVTLMEVKPMLVVGQVAEKSVSQIQLGDVVQVKLITGTQMEGKVTFIARAPDTTTRTYPIEVTVSDPDDSVRAGLTAQMKVPVGRELAHLISPASLVLSDEGVVGVRIVDENDVVHFVPVTVLSEGTRGVWVNGLPEHIRLITVGQEDVFDGQKVKLDLTPLGTIVGS